MTGTKNRPKRAVAPYRDAPRGNTALMILDMITEMDFAGAALVQRWCSAGAALVQR